MTGRRGGWAALVVASASAAAVVGGPAVAQPRPGVPRSAASAPPPPSRMRAGIAITPDTVTVGDPFVIQVRVAAPAGARVEFPAGPDSAGPVELLDPVRETRAATPDGSVDVTATYRAAAWDVGDVRVGLGDVVVRPAAGAAGADRRLPLGALRVIVRSVLPADSALRRPKPVREPLPDAGLWWLRPALLLAALVALIGTLLWLAARWWRRRRAAVPADLAYREAMAAFDRLDRLRLVEAGEGGRHVALAADVVREYLAARRPAADRSLTSGELRLTLAADLDVPHAALDAHLALADLVKFAAVAPPPGAAADAGRAARQLVEDTEAAIRARAEREAAEAAARAEAEREAQRRYEEERRRAARRGGPPDDPPAGRDEVRDRQERAA